MLLKNLLIINYLSLKLYLKYDTNNWMYPNTNKTFASIKASNIFKEIKLFKLTIPNLDLLTLKDDLNFHTFTKTLNDLAEYCHNQIITLEMNSPDFKESVNILLKEKYQTKIEDKEIIKKYKNTILKFNKDFIKLQNQEYPKELSSFGIKKKYI